MPHFGLMDADALGEEGAALQRARLHIRGGKRRLRQGKVSAGIVTLYDALLQALQWYFASPQRRKTLDIKPDEDLRDERVLYGILVRCRALDGTFDFEAFDRLIDRGIRDELEGYDYKPLLEAVESIMRRLGVMPFDEGALPPEDPKTF